MTKEERASKRYINRELSWIEFNKRVLAQALDPRTPLLEQAKFSAIFSNNLDEFFMVRVASLKSQVEAGINQRSRDGLTPNQQLSELCSQLKKKFSIGGTVKDGIILLQGNIRDKVLVFLDDQGHTAKPSGG